MKKKLAQWLANSWYKDSFTGMLLMPLGLIFSVAVRLRKFLYRLDVLKKHTVTVPVVVIGNITVGGTGKTPLIIWLARFLKESGYQPGIISRGYGGQSKVWPQWVTAKSDVKQVGDEALLIARQTGCPMVISPMRVEAARLMQQHTDCNVILSDDGLQHYALNRDIEIAVIDGERRFGNRLCLPAGPLREPINRLQSVDFIVVNGDKLENNEFSMNITGDIAINLATGEQKSWQQFADMECHALAGIGNPDRFFKLLEIAGLICKTHSFPDHHEFQSHDIEFNDDKPVLMTEKDAVKCAAFAGNQHWYIPVEAVPEPGFSEQFLALLREKYDR
ncbi:MAG: tetraacyldisaccharide 4'-kinase [Methylobacter sp.]|nr:tetraacyldisaccharide 4'-kinase [Methylobacter sp.]